ncbi:MAG: hypothetical protein M1455_06475 [Actinobacteria bacterium]|nr:hypothetical protein [Actinomycetota bacterium]
MHKTPPPFKVMGNFGKYLYGFFRSKGAPDFQGYVMSNQGLPIHHAVEVKEADGDTFPASGLKPEQRRRLEDLEADAPGHALVGIYWRDFGTFELFRYRSGRGSYIRGEGLNFPARPLVAAAVPDGGRRDPREDLRPRRRAGRLRVVKG